MSTPFESLDFLYIPTQDVAGDAAYFTDVLGGTLVFAIEEWRTRVAMVEMTVGPPHLLFTDHVDGERPILIYRVEDLEATLERLTADGWERDSVFEIPQGPCCSFRTPGGHRVAVYVLARPEVADHFKGRIDF
ncbi:MAG TPA: VOC family protein [Acidimicrobiia bacterium]